ncbi:methylenetetrahydrofolate--tRNA-(uracil(54)-C(5))-methyltransferase (FADH(2)-oxidizing) TrmFO [Mycoplasma mycoides]|uniref:methylenetetrahydrofolate--tRNA-(uracil(54)- C(5))-methyltransferase (FADH(2)-oxidizing) TrmFO n=1 Tax=Mycoplasma mycoides TaxID=2102 RepID=UPI00223FE089|nr:methylenetetrahydrofolate--tRNA-(uracil(54)-C(5))-methyltransferase (FADH(2)-oxidizing) TrmFO [Mycoplasma mycoides]QVK05493.1 methylenetetrahydrofolate--tRNA-(uracil(54)-C(5))-methyltransferase (FADH(2)-oxidizing) TrmFO [Mycoplasma mycoides subsp. capri]
MKTIRIIGAGLSGCEAAYYLLKKGYFVELYEIKTIKKNPIQHYDYFCELAYSDSFRSTDLNTSVGTLKKELELLDSLIIKAAKYASINQNNELVVNRIEFSKYITNYLKTFNNLKIIEQEYLNIDLNIPTIIAIGPISTPIFLNKLENLINKKNLKLFDSVEPTILKQSINTNICYSLDNNLDYLYCDLNKEQFEKFYNALISAKIFNSPLKNEIKLLEKNNYFSIESLAKNKQEFINHFKPINNNAYITITLKKDSVINNLYTIVNFQTSLMWNEQLKVFSLIPGLENLKIMRYGVMHKNNYINTKKLLNLGVQLKTNKNIFFAGQIIGVDGYVESVCSGLISAINLDRYLNNKKMILPNKNSTIGSLYNYLLKTDSNFSPMRINWALVDMIDGFELSDNSKKFYSKRAIQLIKQYLKKINYK